VVLPPGTKAGSPKQKKLPVPCSHLIPILIPISIPSNVLTLHNFSRKISQEQQTIDTSQIVSQIDMFISQAQAYVRFDSQPNHKRIK
jgi:hypothetical protein